MSSKRQKLSNDPLQSSSSAHMIVVKQEAEDNVIDYLSESLENFNNYTVKDEPDGDFYYDEENSNEILEEQPSEQKNEEGVKRRKNKRHNREDLMAATELVFSGKLSLFKAAELYNISKSSLNYFVRKKRENRPIKKAGIGPVLKESDENEILEWLKIASEIGVCRTQEDFIQAAADIAKINKRAGFKNKYPSKRWVNDFKSRHLKKAKIRHANDFVNSEVFFTKFYKFLEKKGMVDVLERADAFYLMEDTSFELKLSINNAWHRSTYRRSLAKKGGDLHDGKRKNSVTVTYCFGANGTKLPELMIFNDDFNDMVKVALVDREINSKFLFSKTKTGGHTRESFKCYLQRIDVQLKDVKRPIFIFCSDTLPHVNIELFKWCKERQIFIISYIPNEVFILEEFDSKIFGFDNSDWKQEIENNKNLEGNMSEDVFTRLLKKINDRVVTEEKISEVFKKTGIFPFDMSKVQENLEEIDEENENQDYDDEKTEESKGKDQVILNHLKKMRELNNHLKEILIAKNLNHLLKHSMIIEQQFNIFESST